MCNTILGPQTPISPVQYFIIRNIFLLSGLLFFFYPKILADGCPTHTKSVLPKCLYHVYMYNPYHLYHLYHLYGLYHLYHLYCLLDNLSSFKGQKGGQEGWSTL